MDYGRMTRHHRIAQMYGGTWDEKNILQIQEIPHRCHHILFNNDLPIECLRTMLDYAKPTIEESGAYELINGVLQKVEGVMEVYDPRCYDPEKLSRHFK